MGKAESVYEQPPIMMRVAITRAEHQDLRVRALRENRPTKDLAGDFIRSGLAKEKR